MSAGHPLDVLGLVEAEAVTGPVRNLLQFQRAATIAANSGAREVRLTLAVFQRGRSVVETPLYTAAQSLGIPVLSVEERFRFDAGAIASLRRLIDAVAPDIVQTHGVKSHLLVRLASVHQGRPWVAFHHGYTRPDVKMAVYNQCDRVSLRAAARVVTTARAFTGQLVASGVASERIVVLRNAIEIDSESDTHRVATRQKLREALNLAPCQHVIVCIGRLSKEKGHADLVDAIARFRARWPHTPVRLVIAGDGPERDRLVARAARAGIADAIRWLGFVPRADRLYAAADVAVLPSHSEGSPNALLEAAAFSLPVVATAVGGIPETIQHGQSGLLVPPGHPAALADALRDVLCDLRLAARLGREARRVVERCHDPLPRARALISLYDALARQDRAVSVPEEARACAF
jgi:glycosyltransferase involved in cell wall biosynthesis